jgi:hypothetical protein
MLCAYNNIVLFSDPHNMIFLNFNILDSLTHFVPRTSACSFAEFYSVDRARARARSWLERTFLLLQTALAISFE